MKLTAFFLAFAGFFLLTGCDGASPSMLSLESVTTARDTKTDAALVGTWESGADRETLCTIRTGEKGGYDILFQTGSALAVFHAQLFSAGDAELVEVTPVDDNDFRLPGHAVARIWTGGGTLRWAFLDSEWMKQQAAQLANWQNDGKTLLLSPGAAVRELVAKRGADDQAYGKVTTWQKLQ